MTLKQVQSPLARKRSSATRREGYPALRLWQRLRSGGWTKLDADSQILLERAAGWEYAARVGKEAGSRSRERECQENAIGALLFGWSVGDSRKVKEKRARISLRGEASKKWQRCYLENLKEIAEVAS